jgi:hypothetical protein
VATGDFHRETQPGVFYRDTQPDLLWRHDDGYIVVWWMDGPNLVSAAFLNPYWIDPLWRIVGTGDFNDDGKTDIVWQFVAPGQFDDGRVHIWLMDGIDRLQGVNISILGDPRWRAFGTGDYNGDKKTDVLFQFKATLSSVGGPVGVWYLNGTSCIGTDIFNPDPGAYNAAGPR